MMRRVVVYTKPFCGYCTRAKKLLEARGIPYEEYDVYGDTRRLEEMLVRSRGRRTAPQIFVGDVHVGGYEDLHALERSGGLDPLVRAPDGPEPGTQETSKVELHDVVIIGSGPAGLTAAIYAARANLKPVVIEGVGAGGQLMNTTEVENYPGFPEGIQGPELMEAFRKQAERFGSTFVPGDATKVDFSGRPFGIWVDDRELRARSVIVATGAKPKTLGIPGETDYAGRGVSYCATCDGFFFRDKPIVVVGGGDSAMEEALFLAKFGSSVTVVHRRDELRASKIMADRATANETIRFLWDSVVEEVLGDGKVVTSMRVKNLETGETSEHEVAGFFVAIGHVPNTSVFESILPMNDDGYLTIHPASSFTEIPGVFAAGDVHDHVYRQAVTAAGMGCRAAIDCERWLEAEGR